MPEKKDTLPDEGKFWALVSCPICLHVCFGKTFMCTNQHCVCESCFKMIGSKACSQCRGWVGGVTRNRVVEDLIAASTFTCRLGCGKKFKGNMMEAHMAQCCEKTEP